MGVSSSILMMWLSGFIKGIGKIKAMIEYGESRQYLRLTLNPSLPKANTSLLIPSKSLSLRTRYNKSKLIAKWQFLNSTVGPFKATQTGVEDKHNAYLWTNL